MTIHCFEMSDTDRQAIIKALPEVELVCEQVKIQESQSTDAQAEVLLVFVASMVDKAALDRFPKLKYIATRSTGFDHIDLQECKRRGIVVCNVPSYGEHTVAEFAFGLILALSRKVYLGVDRIKSSGRFSAE